MKKLILTVIFALSLAMPASALEIEAPAVPESGSELMPEDTSSFSDALEELFQNALRNVRPDLAEASKVSITVISAVLIISLLKSFSGNVKAAADIAGTVAVASALLMHTNSLIRLGTETVTELSEYGKLLLPVMTTAMAAQGGTASSAMLYTGTAAFDLILTGLISNVLVPLVYLYLALSAANSAIGEDILKRMRDFSKWIISWSLKTLLTVFTTYISISGVITGATDKVALKAAKVTISSVVPVVGGILSDASEAVLVSAGLMKNAAGIYGVLAALAVFLGPFLRIGAHYLVLKVTAVLCSLLATKRISDLIEDFSAAMGLLLAMTASACLMLLISTVCFMKGVG